MDKNSFDLITFGEIMLRLSPPRHARIVDGDIFEKRAGGAELNVASGVALLGLRTGIVSKLPLKRNGMEPMILMTIQLKATVTEPSLV